MRRVGKECCLTCRGALIYEVHLAMEGLILSKPKEIGSHLSLIMVRVPVIEILIFSGYSFLNMAVIHYQG